MKLHVLAIPHTITSKEYLSCAFTQKVLKFCKMMSPFYQIIHYGHEKSEVICHEHVAVTDDLALNTAYGEYDWKKEFFRHGTDDYAHQTFYRRAEEALNSRVEEGDAILCFWGNGHQAVADKFGHKCFIIEPGIGYNAGATFAPHKVFESYAVMHAIYGENKVAHPAWFDAVIPNYFDLEDFEYKENKEDYVLYLGRIAEIKGVNIAIQATENTGDKLVLAGQGNLEDMGYDRTPSHVEYVGYADVEKRKELMKNAKALILPTHYIEPFGGVTIEAMLCGTPIITSDWGCFAENNLHGVTGYRCRNMNDFYWAIKNIQDIKPKDCRYWSKNNFSLGAISKMYSSYFNNINNLKEDGFYQIADSNLEWLNKKYPKC